MEVVHATSDSVDVSFEEVVAAGDCVLRPKGCVFVTDEIVLITDGNVLIALDVVFASQD